MHFVDLHAQQKRISPELRRRIDAVLAHGQYIMGPEVGEFETALSEFAGAGQCVSCASGTDALQMILLAMGIGPGDAVLTSPFTFMATAEVVGLVGATPVFVDVEPDSYNLDPDALEATLEKMAAGESPSPGTPAGLRPRAVMPVDLYGLPADYGRIHRIAAEHDLSVIADGAQSFGGEIDGVRAGRLTHVTATSFFPAKPLGCYGDGGAILTDDEELADVLRSLRVHGRGDHKYHTVRLGLNSRLDTMQAAILLAKLEVFADELAARQKVARRYDELLRDVVTTPVVPRGFRSAWAQYAVMVDERDAVRKALAAQQIPSMDYYPIPLHRQPVLDHLGYAAHSLPVAERLAKQVLCLPMHPYLSEKDQSRVAEALGDAVTERAS
jgi:UDP-2-acetamido-2-deoxy-ribo-hexuluronate aminotransferase